MDLKLVKLINLFLAKNIPFVTYHLPNEESVKTLVQRSGSFNLFESMKEIADKTGFVYAPFHRKTNMPVVFFEPELIIENDNFEDSLIEEISERSPFYPDYTYDLPYEANKKEYQKQAETLIHSFNKEFTKAVLSRVHIENKPKQFDIGKFFIQLQEKYPNAFCHLINIPGAGTWTGASPETLLKIDENKVQTVSLAGTQAKFGGDKEIHWKHKEMEEHRFVSNYIIEVLKRFEISDFQIEGPQTIQAGNAIHLSTKFCFNKTYLQNRMADFMENLHPTPAVCGLPKEKALDLILKTEKHNREYYSGFCGPINMSEKTELYVNLRCMKILKTRLVLFIGGGLTASSVPELEWKETELKAQTLLSLIENS